MLWAARHQEQNLGEQELGWTRGGHYPVALFHKGNPGPEGRSGWRAVLWNLAGLGSDRMHLFHRVLLREGVLWVSASHWIPKV